MWEWPDKRVWYFFGPVFLIAVPYLALHPDNPIQRFVEPLLYLACIFLGGALGALSIRERFSLFHPSTTRDESAFLYWTDVAGSFLFGGFAVWKFLQSISGAL